MIYDHFLRSYRERMQTRDIPLVDNFTANAPQVNGAKSDVG